MSRASSMHGEKTTAYRVLIGKPEGDVGERVILK
jgi:hypothetical protein